MSLAQDASRREKSIFCVETANSSDEALCYVQSEKKVSYKEDLQMKSVILNGLYMEEPEKAHQYIKEKLNLPDRYENNLDTLQDCLNDMQNTHIEVFHSTGRSEYFQEIMQVFRDAGRENDDIIITLE